jgi:hypothetical protein
MTQGEETGLARGPSLLIAAVRTRSTEGGGEGLEGEPGDGGMGGVCYRWPVRLHGAVSRQSQLASGLA